MPEAMLYPFILFCWNEPSPSFCKGNRGSGKGGVVAAGTSTEIYMFSKACRCVHGSWGFMAVARSCRTFTNIGNWITHTLKNYKA